MIRKLLLRRVYNHRWSCINNFTTHHTNTWHLNWSTRCFSSAIKLNDSFPTKSEDEISSKISEAFSSAGYDGILQLAQSTFDEQDLNVSALSYQKLIESYASQNDDVASSEFFNQIDRDSIYKIHYRFIATLHLLKDYESAKHYIENVIFDTFGDNLDGKIYGIYALVLKEGFKDVEAAEKYLRKSIELSPGIENLFSYLNLSAIIYSKENVDWNYAYDFSLNIVSFASFDAYVMSQHGITCTALDKYDEAEACLHDVLKIYYASAEAGEKSENEGFLSYFPDLSHVSLRCLLQILFQHWSDDKIEDKMFQMWQDIEENAHDETQKHSFISKYLLQFVSPIMSQMYWKNKGEKEKAIELIFSNEILLQQEEYFHSLRVIHCFNYWAKLNNLNAVEVLQHSDLHPFYFGCCSIVNGLFEHNVAQLNCAKHAFSEIPKEKVQSIYDEMEKKQSEETDKEAYRDMVIFNYINRLMEQMFHDTLNKIAKIAWGNIALYEFERAQDIAQNMLKMDKENVIAYGILCRIATEQKDYSKAIEIFENHITEDACKSDDLMFFNLMPYYAISLCLTQKEEKGNEILMNLLQKIYNDEEKDEIHVIHKEQIYRWYAYKLQYCDCDYENAVTFYEKSFLQDDKIKYPPIQIEIAKCYALLDKMEQAKENADEAMQNGGDLFGDWMQNQYQEIMENEKK